MSAIQHYQSVATTILLTVALLLPVTPAHPYESALQTLISVRPNLMLLIDTGAHMSAILPEEGYDPEANYPTHDFGTIGQEDTSLIAIDLLESPDCIPGYTEARTSGLTRCLRLPAGHLYNRHYLDYLYATFPDGADLFGGQDGGSTAIPTSTVFDSAIDAARQLVNRSQDIDLCLHVTVGGDQNSILPCGASTAELLGAIDALSVEDAGGQPIATIYPDIVGYFTNDQTSPSEWHCESSAIAVFTYLAGSEDDIAQRAQFRLAAIDALAHDLRTYTISPATSRAALEVVAAAGNGEAISFDAGLDSQRRFVANLFHHRTGHHSGPGIVGSADAVNGAVLYDTSFSVPGWGGKLQAYALNISQQPPASASATILWNAADHLPGHTFRNLFTGVRDPAADITGTVHLGPLQPANVPESTDPALIAWIRGDRDQERSRGGAYPDRDGLVASTIDSSPVLVNAVPDADYPDPSYRAFVSRVTGTGRPAMIYTTANDGMLHGYTAGPDGGLELFGYLPRLLQPHLLDRPLTVEDTLESLALDGQLTVQDAMVTAGDGSAQWRTVAVATGGLGQRGLYALDVTDPTAYRERGNHDPNSVLWEIDPDRDSNSFDAPGYLVNPVSIVRVATADDDQRWLVVTGNGIAGERSGVPENTPLSSMIHVLDLSTGVPYQSVVLAPTGGGMTSVTAADVDGDTYTDRLYAADIDGNIWRLDWNPSRGQFQPWSGDSDTPEPLFTAVSSPNHGSHPQPITSGLEIGPLPGKGSGNLDPDGVMVYFGTGRLLDRTDIIRRADQQVLHHQSLYGVWDDNAASTRREQLAALRLEESMLGSTAVRTVSTSPVVSEPGEPPRGWLIDLTLPGERVIAAPALLFGRVQFTTFASAEQNADLCSAAPREFIVEVDALTGLPTEEPMLDLNQDFVLDEADRTELGDVPAGAELEDDVAAPLVLEIAGPNGPVVSRVTLDQGGVPHVLATPVTTRRIAWRRMISEHD